MEYWSGIMNWPISREWRCETCGEYACLVWGMIHGVCRCDNCHTQYHMRPDGEIVTVPFCLLKPEYKAPARAGWPEYKRAITQWDDSMWDWAFERAEILSRQKGR
jgi:hypothetical protein